MKRMLGFLKRFQRFLRRGDGSATVEFVLMFPLVMAMLMMGAEAGWISVQRVALDRAVDLSVRDVRLGNLPNNTSHSDFRSHVCNRAMLLSNCEERLLVEMRRISNSDWQFPESQSECIDLAEDIAPVTAFSVGAGSSVMYLRACYLVRPLFPTSGMGLRLPLDSSDMFALRTTTGFVNE